jgi:hypothetical protein
MNQLGVLDDLLYLGLGAIAPHVIFAYHVVQARSFARAVDNVPEYFFLALGAHVATEKYLPQRRRAGALVILGH